MKKVTRSLILVSAVTVLASVFQSAPAGAATPTFFCERHGKDLLMEYGTADISSPVILWNSSYFKRSGYSPDTRCKQVANRLQQYAQDETLSNLTNGYINGMPVLCIGEKPHAHKCRPGSERGLALTLSRQDDPRYELNTLQNALSNASARKLYVDGVTTPEHQAEISSIQYHPLQANGSSLPSNLPQIKKGNQTIVNVDPVINACKDFQTPDVINLLNPIDDKLQTCMPGVKPIANKMQSIGNDIKNGIGILKIGNEGSSSLNTLEYDVALNQIKIKVAAEAKHRISTPISVERKITCSKGLLGAGKQLLNSFGAIVSSGKNTTPNGCLNYPAGVSTEQGWLQLYQFSCNYDASVHISPYDFNSGHIDCGGEDLRLKVDTGVVQTLLRGKLPSLVQLIQAVDFKNPLVYGKNKDTYDDKVKELKAQYPNAIMYISSENFVEHMSVKNAGIQTATAIGTLGISSSKIPQELLQLLVSEGKNFGRWSTSHAIGIEAATFINWFSSGLTAQSFTIPNYNVKIALFNTPEIHQRCIAGECSSEAALQRKGFAIVFQPTNSSESTPAGW